MHQETMRGTPHGACINHGSTNQFGKVSGRFSVIVEHVQNTLIDERVAADTSLIVFLSLSNQIINELDRRIGYTD